jgi:hypothetical protein
MRIKINMVTASKQVEVLQKIKNDRKGVRGKSMVSL